MPPSKPPIERLRRYIPADLLDLIGNEPDARIARHLAALQGTVTTYLPRYPAQRLLEQHLSTPWVRYVEGSLLFADLSGSTALAERLSTLGREGTELVTAFLNEIFDMMISVIEAHNGDLVAFGGDALLVFFGDRQHSCTAARASLALQEAMHGYVREVPGMGRFPMHLHVGVESGRVAFVSAGNDRARYCSVLGPVVNEVATAEGLAGPEEVVVGPRTWAAIVEHAVGIDLSDGFVRLERLEATAPPMDADTRILPEPANDIERLLDDLDSLSPYIPPVLLERLVAAPEQPRVEAELRPVTVLFAQVAGLEAATHLPEALAAHIVQAYVEPVQQAIEQFGGVVNKLDVADEGMKLVAIFGAPIAYEDHTERAASAALEMRARLADIQRLLDEALRDTTNAGGQAVILRQRIGLNLGTVFAGNVGSTSRKEYTVMGDAVNVAARVMSKTAWGEVWCSEATTRVLEGRMLCVDRGAMQLKGKAAPLRLFRLDGERDILTTTLAAYRQVGPLVGRTEELERLHQHLEHVLHGQSAVVRINGDVGMGKSRLAAAVVAEAQRRGMRVVPAVCFSYTSGIPYGAWGEWLKVMCGMIPGEDEGRRMRKLSDRLAELGPGMEEWLPILGDLVRLDVPENRLTRGLDPQMRQERRFELLERLLWRAAAHGPLLVLFEDIHWADPISLEIWKGVAQNLHDVPVLLLGVHRPEALQMLAEDQADVIDLHSLSEPESSSLLDVLAGDMAIAAPLRRQIVGRAGGNPLFLAELLRAVLSAPAGTLESLPESLNGLLLSRIDRLDENSRLTLRVASVIGQRFPFDILRNLQPLEQSILLRQLNRLDSEEMTILERVDPERVDIFRHALMQEVTYQSLLFARRRELHGRIGEYLERRYGTDLDDYIGLLAHHYRLSDRRDKAIEYLLKAGHAARNVYANDEAEQDYRWALEALAGDEANPQNWEAHDALGDVYATVGRYEEALAQHHAVLAASALTNDAAQRARRKCGSILEKQGEYQAALAELNTAMQIATSDATGISSLAVPEICTDIAVVQMRLGEYEAAIQICDVGLASLHADSATRQDELVKARLHSTLGSIYGMRGEYPRAQHHFTLSLQVREAVDDLPGMINSHNNLGYLWQLQAEYDQALEHYHTAEELARKINSRYQIAFILPNISYSLLYHGLYAEALARCAEALDLSRQMRALHSTAQTYNTMGICYYRMGSYTEAINAFTEALQTNLDLGNPYQQANTRMHIAQVQCAQGLYEEATQIAQQALQQADSIQAQGLRVEVLNVLAEAALGRGDLVAARHYAHEAAELGDQLGSEEDTGIALRLCGEVHARRGEAFESDLTRSTAIFEAARDRFEWARTRMTHGFALLICNQPHGMTYIEEARTTFAAIEAEGELRKLHHLLERNQLP